MPAIMPAKEHPERTLEERVDDLERKHDDLSEHVATVMEKVASMFQHLADFARRHLADEHGRCSRCGRPS
jgi:hypothetical protein